MSPDTTSIRIHLSSALLNDTEIPRVNLRIQIKIKLWHSNFSIDLLANVEIPLPLQNEANLLVGVQMFLEKVL